MWTVGGSWCCVPVFGWCACVGMFSLENVTIPIPERVGYVLVCGVGIRTSIEHNGTSAQYETIFVYGAVIVILVRRHTTLQVHHVI